MKFRYFASAFAIAGSLLSLPSLAASQISPANPAEFDPVNLRMTVDSCAFAADSVSVTAAGNTFRVAHRMNACFAPGEPRVVDIRLGTLPVGNWNVEVYPGGDPTAPPSERISFSVSGRPQIAIFPPPPRPLTDYSGQWYKPTESGWGLSIHQSPTNIVFAAWYVYSPTGVPVWYTLQSGQWTSSTKWSGKVYATMGPPFFAPTFDPTQVVIAEAGVATLDFEQRPGEEGYATLSYTVGNNTGSKRITRLQF
jgi:hypothetical protein